MLSRNSVESPFTNVSICDRTKLKNMVKEMEFMFNIDNLPTGFIKKMFMKHNKEYFYNYIVDYIYELQNIYLDFFDKGAPSLNGALTDSLLQLFVFLSIKTKMVNGKLLKKNLLMIFVAEKFIDIMCSRQKVQRSHLVAD